MSVRWPGQLTPDPSSRVTGGVRPVRGEVVAAIDQALSAHGELAHGGDPARLVRFEAGGPPVWSIGCVKVGGKVPYWLFVTYGFSHTVSPERTRQAYSHEYSLAVPIGAPQADVWAPALLRHLCRGVLNGGPELLVGDSRPLGAPVTRAAFHTRQQARMPDTRLAQVLVADDPLLGTLRTPDGPVEVRRLYAIDPEEASLVEVWSVRSFLEEVEEVDPLLLTDPSRSSVLADPEVRQRCEARAAEEGGSVGEVYVDGGWTRDGDSVLIHLPGGEQARRVRRLMQARLPFGRPVVLMGPEGLGPVRFDAAAAFAMHPARDLLYIYGPLQGPQMQDVLRAIDPEGEGTLLRLRRTG